MFNAGKDYTGEVDTVINYLRRRGISKGSVLELGCGSGGHAFELVNQGFNVTGVDCSKEMLKLAREKATTSLQFASPKFLLSDVRSLALQESYDVVLSLFHVVSYQISDNDLKETFATAARHLRSGGVFLFDCWYGPAVIWQQPERRVRRIDRDGIVAERLAEPEHFSHENRVCVNFKITMHGSGLDGPETFVEAHNMRYLFSPEIREFLNSDFEDIDIFAWGTCQPPSREDWTAVVLARRK